VAGGGTGLLRGKVEDWGESGIGAAEERDRGMLLLAYGLRVFLDCGGRGCCCCGCWTLLVRGGPVRYVSTIGTDMAVDVDRSTVSGWSFLMIFLDSGGI
jgi:hypothetical protein